MKKRFKLTDSQLAIGMWVYVYLKIKGMDIYEDDPTVYELKAEYLKRHNLRADYWYNTCLLCQKHISENGKCKCPLSEGGLDCNCDSSYGKVTRYFISEENRARALEACRNILKVIIKEAEKGEVENGEEGK